MALQALHYANAIPALRAADLRQHKYEEKRRTEACESSLTPHVELILQLNEVAPVDDTPDDRKAGPKR
jgi:hypothetical protein